MRYGSYGTELVSSSSTNAGVWTIVSLLVAICAGIVLYFTFLNKDNAKNYQGFTKKLYDFLSFKTLSLEAILKICYLVIAIFITITSFSYISTSVIAFLLYLFIGNVVARIIFESALLIIMMYHKLNEINDNLTVKKENKKESKKDEVKKEDNK